MFTNTMCDTLMVWWFGLCPHNNHKSTNQAYCDFVGCGEVSRSWGRTLAISFSSSFRKKQVQVSTTDCETLFSAGVNPSRLLFKLSLSVCGLFLGKGVGEIPVTWVACSSHRLCCLRLLNLLVGACLWISINLVRAANNGYDTAKAHRICSCMLGQGVNLYWLWSV